MATTTDPETEARSDMTPMIDVVFLMIIFFVCIDFCVLEAKLPAFLPKDEGSGQARVEPRIEVPVRIEVASLGTPVHPAGTHAGSIDPATGRPVRYRLQDHRVAWQVGPKHTGDLREATAELRRIAADAGSFVPDGTGAQKLIACVIEPGRGACYEDVARTADACRAAGFVDIHFGGGLGAR